MADSGTFKFSYVVAMISVDAYPWISSMKIADRVAIAVEKATRSKGAELDKLEIFPEHIVFQFTTTEGNEKPTAMVLAVRTAVYDEFRGNPPEGMGAARQQRGYFSRRDFAMATMGNGLKKTEIDRIIGDAKRRYSVRRFGAKDIKKEPWSVLYETISLE